jgi:hypothetical protein
LNCGTGVAWQLYRFSKPIEYDGDFSFKTHQSSWVALLSSCDGIMGEAGIGKSDTAQQLLYNATCKTMSVQASTDIAAIRGI